MVSPPFISPHVTAFCLGLCPGASRADFLGFLCCPRLINKQHKITELIMVIERRKRNAEPAPLSITLRLPKLSKPGLTSDAGVTSAPRLCPPFLPQPPTFLDDCFLSILSRVSVHLDLHQVVN